MQTDDGNITNSFHNATDVMPPRVWSAEVTFRVCVIIILMVATLGGNCALICFTSCSRRLRRCRVNTFLINLAIGDIMVCVFTMTTEIAFVAFGEWKFGQSMKS